MLSGLEALDLTSDGSLRAVGLSVRETANPEWEACQAVGAAAHFLGLQAVVAPSAAGTGVVIAVFEPRIRRGQLLIVSSRRLEM
jgi:RES domain-containing protein